MKTRIRQAWVVVGNEIVCMDVILEDHRIATLDAPASIAVDEIVEASGRYLLPGVIDDQVHFREPGLTHKEDLRTASRACAKGGVTSFLEMPNTKPATTTCALLEAKLALAAEKSLVNYGFFIGATPSNVAELRRAVRTPGIKIFMGSSTGDLLVDDQAALESIFAETTLPIACHCEDESTVRANAAALDGGREVADHSRIRDHEAAVRGTRRGLDLAYRHRHRFHVLHVSTAEECQLVADHRGLITAEACLHHLFFHVGDYSRLGTRIQVNPAIKEPRDNEALWQALQEGRLQVIATDHAPHTLAEKAEPYPRSPSGLPCVENALALMLNECVLGRCTLPQIAAWMSEAPARVWDIVGKGRIAVGYDADLVLVDMERSHVIRDEDQVTKAQWSPWHGKRLTGLPVRTWVRGKEVFRDGLLADPRSAAEIPFDHGRGGYWGTTGM